MSSREERIDYLSRRFNTTSKHGCIWTTQVIAQYFALDWLTLERIAHVSFRLMHLARDSALLGDNFY